MMSQGKDIATRIKDSMVLWYDISRMLDGKLETYALSYANKFGVFIGNEVELYDSYLHITKLSYTSNSYKFGITDPGGSTTDIPAHEITITGIPEGLTLHFTGDERSNTTEDYDTIDFDITQDGTYQIPRLCNSEGLGLGSTYLYMFKANIPEGTTIDCDITITQTPISTTDPNSYMSSNPTLVDLSGNGYDATCTGFAWNESSGISEYTLTASTFYKYSNQTSAWDGNKLTITHVAPINQDLLISFFTEMGGASVEEGYTYYAPDLKFRITGITDGELKYYFRNTQNRVDTLINNGVEYFVPASKLTASGGNTGFEIAWTKINTTERDVNIVFEILPVDKHLVSDGTDDFCIVSGLPALTADKGFTVVAKREVTHGDEILTAFASKQSDATETVGAFTIERGGVDAISGYRMQIGTFGLNNEITAGNKTGFMYCTSTDYNGETSLIKGDHIDSNILVLFKLDGSSDASYCGKYALYSFLLFNRDLTQTEINWVKTNLIEGDYKFE